MGTGYGHVLPGIGFMGVGLWHLYNHTRLHCQHPKQYRPRSWFPAPGVKHLELYAIVAANLVYLFTELVVGPSSHHHPLDPADWTIPASHLHNFEHAAISLAFVIYGAFALRLELHPRQAAARALEMLLAANIFLTELLVFYLHSTDHTGVEWQYHWLLQAVIAVSLLTTLLGVGSPASFAVAYVRSVSVLFQGVWFAFIGVMLYSPKLLPKGCHLVSDNGFFRVPCDDEPSLRRGKALVSLQFAGAWAAVVVFSAWFYLHLEKKYPEVPECGLLAGEEEPSLKKVQG